MLENLIFGSMNIKSFYENGVSLRFSYFISKDHREFEFFMIAREISKSDFYSMKSTEAVIHRCS